MSTQGETVILRRDLTGIDANLVVGIDYLDWRQIKQDQGNVDRNEARTLCLDIRSCARVVDESSLVTLSGRVNHPILVDGKSIIPAQIVGNITKSRDEN